MKHKNNFLFLLIVMGLLFGIPCLSFKVSAQQQAPGNKDAIKIMDILEQYRKIAEDSLQRRIQLLHEVLVVSKEIHHAGGRTRAYNGLAEIYLRNLGQLDSAFYYAAKALAIYHQTRDEESYMRALNTMGLIYSYQRKGDKALELYHDAYEELSAKGDSPNLAMISNNLAMNYGRIGNLNEAEKWMLRVIEISQNIKLPKGILQGYNGISAVYLEKGEPEKALEYTRKALQYAKKNGNQQARAIALINLGRNHYPENKEQSLENYIKAFQVFKEMKDITKQKVVSEQIANIYQELNQYRNALEYSQIYHELNDSIFNAEKTKIIEELQTKYETNKIKLEKESAELKNLQLATTNRRQSFIIAGSLTLMLLLFVFWLLYARQQRLKKQAEMSNLRLKETHKRLEIEQQKRQAELKAVRSQLNPHFIFNVLNSVQEYMISGEKEKANQSLTGVAEMMRKTLKYSEQETITLKEEMELIHLFLDAEKLRFEERLSYEIVMSDEIEEEFIKIPPMLIQPYVENSIKHGLKQKKRDGRIKINVSLTDENLLHVTIEDNGIGRKKAEEYKTSTGPEHASFSTKANEERIKNLRDSTNGHAGVEILDLYDEVQNATGTRVILKVPIGLS